MIRLATRADLPKIAEIYEEILNWEDAHTSHTNWQRGVYPTVVHAEGALKAGTLFVGEEEAGLWGTFILNQVQLPEYEKIPWAYTAAPEEVWVIHTLCVPPSRTGKGRARMLVAFAEEYARGRGGRVIRLDTYEGNHPALEMYPKLGYRRAGSALFHFMEMAVEVLVCFEKALTAPEVDKN